MMGLDRPDQLDHHCAPTGRDPSTSSSVSPSSDRQGAKARVVPIFCTFNASTFLSEAATPLAAENIY